MATINENSAIASEQEAEPRRDGPLDLLRAILGKYTDRFRGSEQETHYYIPTWFPIDDIAQGKRTIAPLLNKLMKYENLRSSLHRKGGRAQDLIELSQILEEQFSIMAMGRQENACLSDPGTIANALRRVSRAGRFGKVPTGGYRLSIRRLPNGPKLPVYRLSRLFSDAFVSYLMVAETLFSSESYPSADSRFVSMMADGQAIWVLSLADFRETVTAQDDSDEAIDRRLFTLSRIFADTFHEDQQDKCLVAKGMGIPWLSHATEFLYLVLNKGALLSDLRSLATPYMLNFFDAAGAYPQPAIRALLTCVPYASGAELCDMVDRAQANRAVLDQAFRSYLSLPISVGTGKTHPLFKLLYANLTCLNRIAPRLNQHDPVVEAAEALNSASQAVVRDTLGEVIA